MTDSVSAEFIASLKAMVLEAVEKEAPPGGLGDDEPLFGPEARLDLEAMLEGRVFLDLYVKVRADWRDDERILSEIGLGSRRPT